MESEPSLLLSTLGEAETGSCCGLVGRPVGGGGPIPCKVLNRSSKDDAGTPLTVKPSLLPKACPRNSGLRPAKHEGVSPVLSSRLVGWGA